MEGMGTACRGRLRGPRTGKAVREEAATRHRPGGQRVRRSSQCGADGGARTVVGSRGARRGMTGRHPQRCSTAVAWTRRSRGRRGRDASRGTAEGTASPPLGVRRFSLKPEPGRKWRSRLLGPWGVPRLGLWGVPIGPGFPNPSEFLELEGVPGHPRLHTGLRPC